MMTKLNNKGFLSMTTIFSFCIVFISILVLVLLTYENNRVVFGIYKQDIKEVLLERQKLEKIQSKLPDGYTPYNCHFADDVKNIEKSGDNIIITMKEDNNSVPLPNPSSDLRNYIIKDEVQQ